MNYIYKITNTINNKIYIGQTTNFKNRMKQHINGKRSVISKAIRKYGKDNFLFEIIDSVDNIDDANVLEKFYIEYYNSITPNGYNIAEGGLNGNKWYGKTEEEVEDIKRRISLKMKEIRTISNPFKDKHHTAETIELLREMNVGDKNPNAKPKEYYETHAVIKSNFKRTCKKMNWNFEDFIEIYSGITTDRKLYYYKYKY